MSAVSRPESQYNLLVPCNKDDAVRCMDNNANTSTADDDGVKQKRNLEKARPWIAAVHAATRVNAASQCDLQVTGNSKARGSCNDVIAAAESSLHAQPGQSHKQQQQQCSDPHSSRAQPSLVVRFPASAVAALQMSTREYTFTQARLGLDFDDGLRIVAVAGEAKSLGVRPGSQIRCVEGVCVDTQESVLAAMEAHLRRPIRLTLREQKRCAPPCVDHEVSRKRKLRRVLRQLHSPAYSKYIALRTPASMPSRSGCRAGRPRTLRQLIRSGTLTPGRGVLSLRIPGMAMLPRADLTEDGAIVADGRVFFAPTAWSRLARKTCRGSHCKYGNGWKDVHYNDAGSLDCIRSGISVDNVSSTTKAPIHNQVTPTVDSRLSLPPCVVAAGPRAAKVAASAKLAAKFAVGSRVEVKYDDGIWYMGTVVSCPRAAGLLDVVFDDDGTRETIEIDHDVRVVASSGDHLTTPKSKRNLCSPPKENGIVEGAWLKHGHRYIGRRARRVFAGHGAVGGVITSWMPPTGTDRALFHMVHDDGDEEDLDLCEVKKAIKGVVGHTTKEKNDEEMDNDMSDGEHAEVEVCGQRIAYYFAVKKLWMPCTVRSKTKWPNWFNVHVDGANSQLLIVRIEEDGEGKVWKRLVNEAQSAAHDTNKHSNASTKGARVGKVGSWALGARITTNFRGYGDYKGTLLRRVRNSANSAWQWVVCYNEDQRGTFCSPSDERAGYIYTYPEITMEAAFCEGRLAAAAGTTCDSVELVASIRRDWLQPLAHKVVRMSALGSDGPDLGLIALRPCNGRQLFGTPLLHWVGNAETDAHSKRIHQEAQQLLKRCFARSYEAHLAPFENNNFSGVAIQWRGHIAGMCTWVVHGCEGFRPHKQVLSDAAPAVVFEVASICVRPELRCCGLGALLATASLLLIARFAHECGVTPRVIVGASEQGRRFWLTYGRKAAKHFGVHDGLGGFIPDGRSRTLRQHLGASDAEAWDSFLNDWAYRTQPLMWQQSRTAAYWQPPACLAHEPLVASLETFFDDTLQCVSEKFDQKHSNSNASHINIDQ